MNIKNLNEKLRKYDLPAPTDCQEKLIRKIIGNESLGASKNVKTMGHLLVTVTNDEAILQAIKEKIRIIYDYIIQTRGQNAPVFENVGSWLLQGMETQNTKEELEAFLTEKQKKYEAQSKKNLKVIAEYGANLIPNGAKVMAFDYSSTVSAILHRASKKGISFSAVIPESRAIQGGKPFVKELVDIKHEVEYIVDIAFAEFLTRTDVVFTGVECLFADGSYLNTIGTRPIALVASEMNVPVYACTELIKIDRNSFVGKRKPLSTQDFSGCLEYPEGYGNSKLISSLSPVLERIPAELIEGFVSEKGVLHPEALWSVAKEFIVEFFC